MPAKKDTIYTINVYDNDGNVVKTCKAVESKLKFGAIRKIMALLQIDDIDDTAALLKTVYAAWDQVTKVLTGCFPDMEDEDWDNIYIEELLPVLVGIIKMSISNILSIPNDSKN